MRYLNYVPDIASSAAPATGAPIMHTGSPKMAVLKEGAAKLQRKVLGVFVHADTSDTTPVAMPTPGAPDTPPSAAAEAPSTAAAAAVNDNNASVPAPVPAPVTARPAGAAKLSLERQLAALRARFAKPQPPTQPAASQAEAPPMHKTASVLARGSHKMAKRVRQAAAALRAKAAAGKDASNATPRVSPSARLATAVATAKASFKRVVKGSSQ